MIKIKLKQKQEPPNSPPVVEKYIYASPLRARQVSDKALSGLFCLIFATTLEYSNATVITFPPLSPHPAQHCL